MHLTVIPERCSGCKVCELACSVGRAGANNPKKSRIRVMVMYPHPVIRMPIVCKQCGVPKCGEGCPTNAIYRVNGTVHIDEERCISCYQCITSCPFGAMFLHEDIEDDARHGGDHLVVRLSRFGLSCRLRFRSRARRRGLGLCRLRNLRGLRRLGRGNCGRRSDGGRRSLP